MQTTIKNKNATVHDLEQRTPEWFNLRLGRFTSSEIFKLMTEPRSKAAKEAGELSQGAKTYAEEVAAELIYKSPAPFLETAAVQWGKENEPLAVEAYEQTTGRKVSEIGFITMGDFTGSSPDGLTDDGGQIEIKCPFNRLNHLQNVINLNEPADLLALHKNYFYQVQHQLYLTGLKYCDFVSFDPRLLEGDNWALCIKILRIEPDAEIFARFDEKIQAGANYINDILNALNI